MISVQQWLESQEEYNTKEKREKITELDISAEIVGKTLEGSLSLKDFKNLKEFECNEQKLTDLDLTACPNLTKLVCSSCQLTKLDLHKCSQLEDLDCSFNNLSELKVGCCPNLQELRCGSNQFSELILRKNKKIRLFSCIFNQSLIAADLSNCRELEEFLCVGTSLLVVKLANCDKLKKFSCFFGNLPNLNFLDELPFPEKLKILELNNNTGLSAQDLSCFNKLTGLKELSISNNPFYGSLKDLSNLTKLKNLNIANTNISEGLEYLPESLEEIYCHNCPELISQLGECKKNDNLGCYYYQDWRKINPGLIEKKKLLKPTLSSSEKISAPTLEYLIGEGGYGEVYYGKWKLQDVAVKKLYLSPNNISQSDIQDIMNEINILKKVRNRYIIQYYGIYSDSQQFLIIMDYAENGTLTKFINDNKDKEQDWKFSKGLIKQMTRGLAYIHHENIIHRDLKSMNILLAHDYQVKISDFGLAKTKIVSSSSQSKHSAVGTLRWMAPEILKEKKYSEQSDIYALGMIIWEIAAKCTLPFKDLDNNLVMFKIVFSKEKETIPSSTPENVQNIIQQCWKDDVNERINLVSILKIIEDDGTKFHPESQIPEATSGQFLDSKDIELNLGINSLNIQDPQEQSSLQAQIQIPPK